jgi:hypothetical protein
VTQEELNEKLIQSIYDNSPDQAAEALALGADVNTIYENKPGEEYTLVYLACIFDYIELVKILLDAGADPNLTNGDKMTPLTKVAFSGNIRMARILLAAGADPNIADHDGWRPLHYAARRQNSEMLEIILEAKADINARDGRGNAPLHYAASNGRTDLIYILLARGADETLENQEGKTAFKILHQYYSKKYTDNFNKFNEIIYLRKTLKQEDRYSGEHPCPDFNI